MGGQEGLLEPEAQQNGSVAGTSGPRLRDNGSCTVCIAHNPCRGKSLCYYPETLESQEISG